MHPKIIYYKGTLELPYNKHPMIRWLIPFSLLKIHFYDQLELPQNPSRLKQLVHHQLHPLVPQRG